MQAPCSFPLLCSKTKLFAQNEPKASFGRRLGFLRTNSRSILSTMSLGFGIEPARRQGNRILFVALLGRIQAELAFRVSIATIPGGDRMILILRAQISFSHEVVDDCLNLQKRPGLLCAQCANILQHITLKATARDHHLSQCMFFFFERSKLR